MTKVLTEADAAADLAGLPRPVSSVEQHMELVSDLEALAIACHDGDDPDPTPDYNDAYDAVVSSYADLVSERDALAGRVAELERDAELVEWLEKNLFHVEPDEWTRTHRPHLNTWRIFAPKGVQGSARTIINAAIRATKGGKL